MWVLLNRYVPAILGSSSLTTTSALSGLPFGPCSTWHHTLKSRRVRGYVMAAVRAQFQLGGSHFRPWSRTLRPFDGCQSWSSEPYSVSLSVCQDKKTTQSCMNQMRCVNLGRGVLWPYMSPTSSCSRSPSSAQLRLPLCPAWPEIESTSLDTVAGGKAVAEVPPSVQKGQLAANSQLWLNPGLKGIQSEQCHSGLLGARAICFSFADKTGAVESWLTLSSTSTMLGADDCSVKSCA